MGVYSKNLVFKKAQPKHRQLIDSLMVVAFTPYVQKLHHKDAVGGPYPWLLSEINSGNVYICSEGIDIKGVVVIQHQEADLSIDYLAVDPTHQNEGIGSWLLDQMIQMARKMNIKTIRLNTAEMMGGLLRFYRSHGFDETHKALPGHKGDTHIRVYMVKIL
jgi:GNAT superfamily N-acetyltransferase